MQDPCPHNNQIWKSQVIARTTISTAASFTRQDLTEHQRIPVKNPFQESVIMSCQELFADSTSFPFPFFTFLIRYPQTCLPGTFHVTHLSFTLESQDNECKSNTTQHTRRLHTIILLASILPINFKSNTISVLCDTKQIT